MGGDDRPIGLGAYRADLIQTLGEAQRVVDECDPEGPWIEIERAVYWCSFVIRKLTEVRGTAPGLVTTRLSIKAYPCVGLAPRVGTNDILRLHELYDIKAGTTRLVEHPKICNWILHSRIFVPSFDRDSYRLLSIFFSSDLTMDKELFELDWSEFRRMVELAASGGPNFLWGSEADVSSP